MSQSTKPLVSVITPGWNGQSFVHRLLDSLLAQTYRPFEYIYVDDGSTDGTAAVVQSYRDRFEQAGIRFQYIRQENGGVSVALNTGLQQVRGEYLCWPEYDDFLEPEAIEAKLEYLVGHPDCAVVSHDANVYFENDLQHPVKKLSDKLPQRFDPHQFKHLLLSQSTFIAGCHMARTDLFFKTHPGGRIVESRIEPNWQMLLPLYYHYKSGYIDRPLLNYIKRQSSISNQKKTLADKLRNIDEYQRIIRETLLTIDMPEAERQAYLDKVAAKYAKNRFHLAFDYHDREKLRKFHAEMKTNGLLAFREQVQYGIGTRPWLRRIFDFVTGDQQA